MPKFEIITEGITKLYVSKGKISKKLPVFYNPSKEFDRDLSVILLKALGKKTVLDLLAASGARGLRLAKEAGCNIFFNDINSEAIKLIKKNAKLNKIKPIKVTNKRADELLTSTKEKFDFIDIDPFGSPITYVYQAITKLEKDGILAVTATDTAPLYGVYPKTCFRKYGSYPLHVNFGHEIAIRILAKAVIEIAAKQNICIIPIFSHATQHYYRIYFQASRSYVERVLDKIGFIYFCRKCRNRFATKFLHKEKCTCGNQLEWTGPLYIGNLWDTTLVEEMMKHLNPATAVAELTKGKTTLTQVLRGKKVPYGNVLDTVLNINGLKNKHMQFLETVFEESKIDIPCFYETDEFGTVEPRINEVIEKLKKSGLKASRTHFSGKGIRTNADVEQLKKCF